MPSDHHTTMMRTIVINRLESLHQAGVLQLPKAAAPTTSRELASVSCDVQSHSLEDAKPAASTPLAPDAASPPSTASSVPAAGRPAEQLAGWQPARPTTLFDTPAGTPPEQSSTLTLETLRQQVSSCTRCSELAGTRTQTVFGVGNPHARLCFLGEAPGADEDKTGVPFVGRGGQLLTKIIEACRLTRDEVYILNMIKCRPPSNRNPLPLELANCRGYLEGQLELIRPEFICCLGAVASQNLLGTTVSIGKLRGKIHTYRGAKVVCTYHPAFLLRSPAFKKETWEDMKFLMREMGVAL